MKRHSITAILDRMQTLTIRLLREEYNEPGIRKLNRIRKAAVNEIIRLHAEETLPEIDMKKESEKFLESVKTICEDYNAKILSK
jgi:hypothetical protein